MPLFSLKHALIESSLFLWVDEGRYVLVASILGVTTTTVGEELKYNPRLTKSKKEFMEIMEQLGLTRPARMGN